MEVFLDESLIVEIETQAVEMAGQAGKILQRHFGKPLEVEYKDKGQRDPGHLGGQSQRELSV